MKFNLFDSFNYIIFTFDLHFRSHFTEFDEEIRKLNTIPVSSDTYRVRQKKAQIEKELNRIEEAMNSLKRLKVFVKIENV